jgi:hypothetical protein
MLAVTPNPHATSSTSKQTIDIIHESLTKIDARAAVFVLPGSPQEHCEMGRDLCCSRSSDLEQHRTTSLVSEREKQQHNKTRHGN